MSRDTPTHTHYHSNVKNKVVTQQAVWTEFTYGNDINTFACILLLNTVPYQYCLISLQSDMIGALVLYIFIFTVRSKSGNKKHIERKEAPKLHIHQVKIIRAKMFVSNGARRFQIRALE